MEKQTRVPRQKRSLEKQQQLLNAASELFGRQGYHNTTTNHIANAAGLSIGTLYSYYADKEALLLTLLDQYNSSFDKVFDDMWGQIGKQRFLTDRVGWSRTLLELLVGLHQKNLAFAKELRGLYYQIPAVAQTIDSQQARMSDLLIQLIVRWRGVSSPAAESVATIIMDCYTAVVDRAVFGVAPKPEAFLETGAHLLDGIIDKALEQISAP